MGIDAAAGAIAAGVSRLMANRRCLAVNRLTNKARNYDGAPINYYLAVTLSGGGEGPDQTVVAAVRYRALKEPLGVAVECRAAS